MGKTKEAAEGEVPAADADAAPADEGDKAAPSAAKEEAKGKEAKKDGGGGGGGKGGADGADPLDAVVKLMEEQKFDKAVAELQKLLKKQPDDPVVLHNLGVVFTEQCRWQEAEEIFMKAFEAQQKAGNKNYATLFGLATVLTEQGGAGKLLQAEALFRDCLEQAIAQEERGVFETYRTFTSLAENLGLQKRWTEAAEAYAQSLELGTRMFGESHDRNLAQAALLERARRLARLQKYMRYGLWAATAAVPVVCIWMWNYVGGPSIREMFGFAPAEVPNEPLPDLGGDAVPLHGGEL